MKQTQTSFSPRSEMPQKAPGSSWQVGPSVTRQKQRGLQALLPAFVEKNKKNIRRSDDLSSILDVHWFFSLCSTRRRSGKQKKWLHKGTPLGTPSMQAVSGPGDFSG